MRRKPLITYLWVIMLCCPVAYCLEMISLAWKTTSVSESLLSSAGTTTIAYSASSNTLCAMGASQLPWANLCCYSLGKCVVSSLYVAPFASSTSLLDPVECMTAVESCIYNGNLLREGTMVTETTLPCDKLVCKNRQMIPVLTAPGICRAPFTLYNPYGCFFFNLSSPVGDFCAGRLYCQSLGGDLWTFEKNQNFAYVNASGNSIGAFLNDFFVGMYGSGSDFYWINGGGLVNNYSTILYSSR